MEAANQPPSQRIYLGLHSVYHRLVRAREYKAVFLRLSLRIELTVRYLVNVSSVSVEVTLL